MSAELNVHSVNLHFQKANSAGVEIKVETLQILHIFSHFRDWSIPVIP